MSPLHVLVTYRDEPDVELTLPLAVGLEGAAWDRCLSNAGVQR